MMSPVSSVWMHLLVTEPDSGDSSKMCFQWFGSGIYQRLLALVASLDLRGDAERRLADINRVATSELWL